MNIDRVVKMLVATFVAAVTLTVVSLTTCAALVPMPQSVKELQGCVRYSAPVYEQDASLGHEAYRLRVGDNGIVITSSSKAGAFYAEKTLAQLRQADGSYPAVEIEDWPAYPWRGFLLDEGRHFFGKETVKRVLDLMAYHKLNVFHWHLTEDQGWRIDVPGMPELVKYGSVRPESPSHDATLKKLADYQYRSESLNGIPYGPYFYSESDLREIVAYAKERHIKVVPEIDMPGHALAILAAYPKLACFPENIKRRMAWPDWGIFADVLCVGNDDTLGFLYRVLDYVCDVFPSDVIHIGGDECPFVNWAKCPKCQARMKAEGLKEAKELQGWLTTKVAEYLAKKGRRIMGWDEILAGNVPQSAIGQSWRTSNRNGSGTDLVSGGLGAERGHDMVMTPHDETYYAYQQGLGEDPFARDGEVLPLEKAYSFDPARSVSPSAKKRILGSEACLWSEYIWNEYDLAWRAWPRTCAMAEVLWRNPAPRDYSDFEKRMEVHRKRLIRMGVNCAPLK